jgi:transcriptional regulator with XRE-family HTH domain
MTGVAEFTISEIETGKRASPRPSTLRKLAQALKVEVADLYGGFDSPLGEAPPELDADDLEDWASGVDSIPELKRAATRLWPLYGQLAGTVGRPVSAEDAGQLAEVGRKLDILRERMAELAMPSEPLATITDRRDGPTEIHFLREPTLEERARVRREYPDALEVEARETAVVW